MYKVMIIDDEPIIAEGLTRVIPWEKWDCRVAATAYDGLEGQELIRKYKPELVISDISMPGQSGLNMLAALKSEFPDMEVTILTGYRDFDYAQQAIRLGVTRFLLKPSDINELQEAVETMVKNLERKGLGGAEKKPEEEKESAAGSFIVNNAVQYMKEHYQEKITLGDLAEKIYVSQWHLSKLLNRHTGKNFSELLNSVRVEQAKELLKNPSFRIGDVAENVGFSDVTHFSRVFKRIAGMAPNDYRNHL